MVVLGGESHHLEPAREGAGPEQKCKGRESRFCTAVHASLSSSNGSLHTVGSHKPEAKLDGSFRKLCSPLGTDLTLHFLQVQLPPSI